MRQFVPSNCLVNIFLIGLELFPTKIVLLSVDEVIFHDEVVMARDEARGQGSEVKVTLRLPGELHGDLLKQANSETRSLNGQIVHMLLFAMRHQDNVHWLEMLQELRENINDPRVRAAVDSLPQKNIRPVNIMNTKKKVI